MKTTRRNFVRNVAMLPAIIISERIGTFIDEYGHWQHGIIRRIAGDIIGGYSGDHGLANQAQLNGPAGLAIDALNNIYVAEIGNNTIRKIDYQTHIITTVAGIGSPGFSGDGDLAINAELNRPEGVFVDRKGNIYIADSGNQRIRKVEKNSGKISTVAGTGAAGFNFHNGPALEANLNHPSGIVVDSEFNVYFNDYANDLIRKISNGAISTYAGTGMPGYSGDGGLAINACINDVYGLAIDTHDDIYFVDSLNFCVRKIDQTNHVISTVIGKGQPGELKEFVSKENAYLGGVAHKKGTIGSKVAHGLDVDGTGNIFIAETGVNRLRMFNKHKNSFYTVAGNGISGIAEDLSRAIESEITLHGVRVNACGEVYFLDYIHNLLYAIVF